MDKVSWFLREEDWILKRSIIFNKNLVRLTFLEVDRLIKLLGGVNNNAKVLDLCCGIGRHSIELARRGLDVTGTDITNSYLEIARENSLKEGLQIDFIQGDMRYFCRPNSFDLIVNLCTSFGYFDDIEDDIKVLKNVYNSLKPKGKFVIEILGKEVIASTFRKTEEEEFEGHKMIATSKILNNWSMLECKRKITRNGVEEEIVAYHRLYSAVELKRYLVEVGFDDIQIYGNFAGLPYDDSAKTLIMVCGK